jgi:hypothetical protein
VKPATAAGLLALLLALAARASPPDAMQFGAEVRAGRVDPASFDFEAAGFWELDAATRKTWPFLAAWVAGRENVNPGSSCEPADRRNFALLAWAAPASEASDAPQWREARSQLAAGLRKLDALLDAQARQAAAGDDPRLAELLERFARDQVIRRNSLGASWQDGMSRVAANSWGWLTHLRMLEIDCDNTRWLKEQLQRVRWFDVPTYGEAADAAAWHLVQHADREPQFQRDMLALLQSLPAQHTSQKNVAYLWDRVAGKDGRPQRYGTQGTCQPDGSWQPNPVEDAANLDARRQALGMKPMAEHAPVLARESCPQPATK